MFKKSKSTFRPHWLYPSATWNFKRWSHRVRGTHAPGQRCARGGGEDSGAKPVDFQCVVTGAVMVEPAYLDLTSVGDCPYLSLWLWQQ